MTDSELSPEVIKLTQDTLGQYVKKPSLSEKLLKKPPFRFLFDVFKVVIKDTGAFEGLYSEEELNFENIKDKDDKMKFLQKMIDAVKITSGKSLTVRSSKIVSGHEPDKTNELLQTIGEIIQNQMDWKTAIQKVNNAGKIKDPDKPKDSQMREKDKEKVKEKDKNRDREKVKKKEVESKIKETKTKDNKVSTKKPNTPISKSTTPTSKSVTPTTSSDKTKKMDKEKENRREHRSGVNMKEKKEKEKVKPKEKEKDKTKERDKDKDKKIKGSSSPNEKPKVSKPKTESINTTPSPLSKKSENENMKNAERTTLKIETKERKTDFPEKAEKVTGSEQRKEEVLKASEQLIAEKSDKRRTSKEQTSGILGDVSANYEHSNDADLASEDKSSLIETVSAGETPSLSEQLVRDVDKTKTAQRKSSLDKHRLPSGNGSKKNEESKDPEIPAMTKVEPLPTDLKRESTFIREKAKEAAALSAMTGNSGMPTDANVSSAAPVSRPRTSLRPPSARPPSARPGAPRRRDKNIEIILQPNDSVKMSGINVKLESFGDLDDDGENLVIIEDPNADDILGLGNEKAIDDPNNLEHQGHLVQQILETQKELVHQDPEKQGKDEKDANNLSTFTARQSSARQMTGLRDVIQTLTKSVNPLGKLMEFIPEDIDGMQLEWTMWRDSYAQAAMELKREKSLTESTTEPMKNQLIQIEATINEYVEMVDSSRNKILQNTEKILKLLTET